jgi:hypothetical protein
VGQLALRHLLDGVNAFLPESTRLLMLKDDGSVLG